MYEVILEPISNRADWIESFELVDDDTNAIITDLSSLTVQLDVRDGRRCQVLTATTENGKVEDVGNGIFQWHFEASEMNRLCAQSYEIGLVIKRDGIVWQEFIGTLPVVDGVVRR